MRSKLQAVQEVMRRVGKLPADDLDTGGSSVESHIERALDDALLQLQGEGWWWNTRYNVALTRDAAGKVEVGRIESDTEVTIGGVTASNPCVITTSNGTTSGLSAGQRVYIENIIGTAELNDKYFRIKQVLTSTTFSIDEDSTGHTGYVASGKATPLRTIYHVDTDREDVNVHVTRKGDFLFDVGENTDVFTTDLKVRYVYERAWEEVPDAYQVWSIANAALNYNRNYLGNAGRDSVLQAEVIQAKQQAYREEIRTSDVNLLDTYEMNQIRGRSRMPDRRIY